jgi:hypothetical protein
MKRMRRVAEKRTVRNIYGVKKCMTIYMAYVAKKKNEKVHHLMFDDYYSYTILRKHYLSRKTNKLNPAFLWTYKNIGRSLDFVPPSAFLSVRHSSKASTH